MMRNKMLHLAVEPDYEDDESRIKYRKSMLKWDKKLERVDNEMLVYINCQTSYLMEKRSQEMMAEQNDKNRIQ